MTAGSDELITAIDACLPQTQCTKCSYPRCLDYARAIAAGGADINQCPPGGEPTIKKLAALLIKAVKPLNEQYGKSEPRQVAVIRETECIGCTLCIQACPVDAIVGAGKLMHTVIAEECTGCDLCVAPCPVDCIELIPASAHVNHDSVWPDYSRNEVNRFRYNTNRRLQRFRLKGGNRGQAKTKQPGQYRALPGDAIESGPVRQYIASAVARAKSKRQSKANR